MRSFWPAISYLRRASGIIVNCTNLSVINHIRQREDRARVTTSSWLSHLRITGVRIIKLRVDW